MAKTVSNLSFFIFVCSLLVLNILYLSLKDCDFAQVALKKNYLKVVEIKVSEDNQNWAYATGFFL